MVVVVVVVVVVLVVVMVIGFHPMTLKPLAQHINS
jgi:hypothetical protein